jgi:hypothetical protein
MKERNLNFPTTIKFSVVITQVVVRTGRRNEVERCFRHGQSGHFTVLCIRQHQIKVIIRSKYKYLLNL